MAQLEIFISAHVTPLIEKEKPSTLEKVSAKSHFDLAVTRGARHPAGGPKRPWAITTRASESLSPADASHTDQLFKLVSKRGRSTSADQKGGLAAAPPILSGGP